MVDVSIQRTHQPYTVFLTEHGHLRIETPGVVPATVEEAIKQVPGRRRNGRAWEWGFATDTVLALARGGVSIEPEVWAQYNATLDMGLNAPNQRTPVLPRPRWISWRAATPGREHQWDFKWWRRGGGLDGRVHRACLLEAGKGTGKTLSAIEEILELLDRQPDAMILVLARNSNLATVWEEQLDEHAPTVPYQLLRGPRKARLADLVNRVPGCVYVHNHEDLPAMGSALAALDWTMIVIDESSRFRNANAKRTGFLTGNRARVLEAPLKIALSGSPVIKQAFDLYPTLKWLGAPTGNKSEFAERFIELGGYTGNEEVGIKDVNGLNRLLSTVRFTIPKGSVLNLPRAWHYERVTLKPWQRESYRRIQKDLRTQFARPDGSIEERLIRNPLGERLRLTQITAGFEAISTEKWNWRDDNAKTEYLLEEVLPEFEGEPLIVWAHYHAEIASLNRLIRARGRKPVMFFGGHPGTQAEIDRANDAAYTAFKSGAADTFIANTAKAAHGLNLPHAHAMIYYTRTPDTEVWEQSLERNARLTSDGALLNVVVIEAEDSVDQLTTKTLGDDMHKAAQLTAIDINYMLGLER